MSEFELPEMDELGNIKTVKKSGLKKFPQSSASVSKGSTPGIAPVSFGIPPDPNKPVVPPKDIDFSVDDFSVDEAITPMPTPVHSIDGSDVAHTQTCVVKPLLVVNNNPAPFPDAGTDEEKHAYIKEKEVNRIANLFNTRRRVPSQVKLHKPIPKDFVLPGLRRGDLGMIAAPGATGKTFLVLSLAMALSGIRKEFLGRVPETTGRVIMLAGEDDENIIDLRTWHMLPPDAVDGRYDDNFVPIALSGEVPYLVEKQRGKLVRGEWFEPIRQLAEKTTLLVIDPLRRFHEADENDSQHMTFVVQTMEAIAKETDCAIIFTHHTGKAATMSGQGDAQQAARGSSAITDGVRWQVNMVGMSEDEAKKFGIRDDERRSYLRIVFAKTNYSAPLEDWWCHRGMGGILEPWYPPLPGCELNFGMKNDKT